MFAIVEITGQQFKVEEGKKIFVHRLETEEGKNVEFDKVLLIEDNDKVIVGAPTVKDFIVTGKVLDHMKGDKVIVFKKKRKKGYRIKNGHRQYLTQVEILSIGVKGAAKKAEKAKEDKPAEENIATVAEAPAEEKAAVKKPAVKKNTAKKADKKESPVKKAITEKSADKKVPGEKTPVRKSAKENK